MEHVELLESDEYQSDALWQQDNVSMTSVGVDIGSSGTQVILSRLHLRRMGEELTSRYVVTNRESLYRSELRFTPFDADDLIDADALGRFLDEAYAEAQVTVDMVDTGAVILTGEALRRRNAERIATVVAERAGDLVCATAGHELEAHLAAYGSGASRLSHEQGSRLLNVDIGGGTTKLAIVERGRVVASGALGVGGRLLAVDDEDRLIRLEPLALGTALGSPIEQRVGDRFTRQQRQELAGLLSAGLASAIWGPDSSDSPLWLTVPLPAPFDVDGVVFSGGVAEYVGGGEERDFGDLGPFLGIDVPELFAAHGLEQHEPDERIRATVIGASSHTVQLSGNTSWLGDQRESLPRRNLEVVTVDPDLGSDATGLGMEEQVLAALSGRPERGDVAIAFDWTGDPLYADLRSVASAIADLLQASLAHVDRLYVLINGDIAMTIGRILTQEFHVDRPVIVLDGLNLQRFDFVDLGRVRQPSNTVPVTIKSLHFSSTSPVGATA